MTITLDALNATTTEAFIDALDGVFEHARWVAERAAAGRPFATVADLHDALMGAVRGAPAAEQLAFLQGHPALSLAAANLTPESRSEQAGLGLGSLAEDYAKFDTASAAYTEKFKFPFLVCVRRQTARSILSAVLRRIEHGEEQERATALDEIGFITNLRLTERVTGPGARPTTGHLSTHILDTAKGGPAAGVLVELFREGVKVAEAITNDDGRTPAPLIEREPLRVGRYELRFHVGAYFSAYPGLPDPAWFDVIPLRFAISEPEGHYHVPLLVSPWAYTTYRGS